MEGPYVVWVGEPRRQRKIIELCDTEEQFRSMKVRHLREKVALKFPEFAVCECPRQCAHLCAGRVRLFLRYYFLDYDDCTLVEYGVNHMADILLITPDRGAGNIPSYPHEGFPDKGKGDTNDHRRSMERLGDF